MQSSSPFPPRAKAVTRLYRVGGTSAKAVAALIEDVWAKHEASLYMYVEDDNTDAPPPDVIVTHARVMCERASGEHPIAHKPTPHPAANQNDASLIR